MGEDKLKPQLTPKHIESSVKIDLTLKKRSEDVTPENLTGQRAHFFLWIVASLNISIFMHNLGLLRWNRVVYRERLMGGGHS